MAPEPPIEALPEHNWPPMVDRLEMAHDMPISEVAYWLALESRKRVRGVVARLGDREVFAWPHMTVDQIIRSHIRLGEVSQSVGATGRWSPERKKSLLDLVRRRLVDRRTAAAEFGISDEEWGTWDRLWPDVRRAA